MNAIPGWLLQAIMLILLVVLVVWALLTLGFSF